MHPKQATTTAPGCSRQSVTSQPGEDKDNLSEEQLDQVAGGIVRRGGDDDLDDLEVER